MTTDDPAGRFDDVPDLPRFPPIIRRETFHFTGIASEYFRIWIVNLLLSVVTLGIYSAWAKVRRLQYFYRNTCVAGSTFDYHAKPIAILKGRIIATALFGSYYLAAFLDPMLGVIVLVLLVAILPWLVVRSLRFRFHNTSYRGLRFGFHGSTAEAYWTLLFLPVLASFTLFILTPLAHHRLKRYQYGNSGFGRTRFAFDAPVAGFYSAYLTAATCILGLLALTGLAIFFLVQMQRAQGDGSTESPLLGMAATGILMLAYAVGAAGSWALMTTRIQNLVWNHTRIGSCRFRCTLQARRLFVVMVTNVLGIVFTLGLFKPFAQIRLASYMLSEFCLVTEGSLDEFVAAEQQDVNAVGDAAAEIFDIDIAV